MKRLLTVLLVLVLLCGCSGEAINPTVTAPSLPVNSVDDIFSDSDLRGDYSGEEILQGSVITAAGTYLLQGEYAGQIMVDAGEKADVHLVLQGAQITCEGSAAIYIKNADKVIITLVAGTENRLESVGDFVQTDENTVDAALFSKTDLTVNGSGSLRISCPQGHGIVCKDDLKIASGSYTVEAGKQGISGKDSLSIASGSFTVTAGSDGLQSKHDEDAAKGNIYIAGGDYQITAGADGLDASNQITVLGGSLTVKTGGGSAAGAQSGGGEWGWRPRAAETNDGSYKALKAGTALVIVDGTVTVDAQEDALHCNGTVQISGGQLQLAAGDDGLHADTMLDISGGEITVTDSYEGLESATILISGGKLSITARDDGLNAAGGSDGSGFGGPWGGGDMFADDGSGVIISGGELWVDAGGDGLDSNGSLTVTGGSIYVDGPTNSGNGALDCNGTALISGGTVIAVGASGMAENFDAGSSQGSILYSLSAQAAGTEVALKDQNGTVLAAYTARKQFSSVVISAPGIQKGQTYVLTVGSQSYEIRMEDTVYSSGGGGFGPGGQNPGGNGPGGGRPRP